MEEPTFFKLANALNANAGTIVGIAGATVGISVIAELIVDGVKKLTGMVMKKVYFEKMLAENPQLQEVDPQILARYWSSLYHFAPHVAADPLAAGAYLTQTITKISGTDLVGPTIDTYNSLSNIHKNYATIDKRGPSDLSTQIRGAGITGGINQYYQTALPKSGR